MDSMLHIILVPFVVGCHRQRGVSGTDVPSQILSCLLPGTAQTVHILPLGRVPQRVACFYTVFGYF